MLHLQRKQSRGFAPETKARGDSQGEHANAPLESQARIDSARCDTLRKQSRSLATELLKATVSIDDLTILKGKLPPKVLGLVIEWASQHQEELLNDWSLSKLQEELRPIDPLE